MENKQTLRLQSSPAVAFDVSEDKIESSENQAGRRNPEKLGDEYQSEKTAEGYLSEKTAEGYQTHESEDTEVSDPKEIPSKSEKSNDENGNEQEEYVTGLKALLILGAVTGACFILLLDTSIISTVRLPSPDVSCRVLILQ